MLLLYLFSVIFVAGGSPIATLAISRWHRRSRAWCAGDRSMTGWWQACFRIVVLAALAIINVAWSRCGWRSGERTCLYVGGRPGADSPVWRQVASYSRSRPALCATAWKALHCYTRTEDRHLCTEAKSGTSSPEQTPGRS